MEESKHINEKMRTIEADIRQPSINTEPRTLNEMSMERAMLTAQKVFASHPSEDFTKDAFDTATRETVPAKDATDGLVQNVAEADLKAPVATEGPTTPPTSPTM